MTFVDRWRRKDALTVAGGSFSELGAVDNSSESLGDHSTLAGEDGHRVAKQRRQLPCTLINATKNRSKRCLLPHYVIGQTFIVAPPFPSNTVDTCRVR